MKEKSSLAKRLSGLIALALVLAMTMGITASAATTYYVNSEKTGMYSNQAYTQSAPALLNQGDMIQSTSGTFLVKVDGEDRGLAKSDSAYTINDPGTFAWNILTDNGTFIQPGSDYAEGYVRIVELTTVSTQSTTKRSCNHRAVELRTVRETTATQDGIRAWFCVDCDEKLSEEMLSSYAFFLQSIIYQIEHAESGSTVEISSEIWNSLSQDVMLALAARRDINIVFTLRYNHEDYRIEIPAGTTIDTKDAYYGPLYLGQLYGMTKIKK